jgi:glycosyltransferase involved in cell wall biosynthesis
LIVFAGRLSPEKNLFTLLAAAELVLGSHPHAAFLIFGEGPLRGELEGRIKRSRFPGRMVLLGFSKDLWRWMRSASAFVSISEFEGSPNSVLEAMAIGCPLVVSDIPSHREILDESMATFCRADSVQDVATRINETLANTGAAQTRAGAARSHAQAWSIESSARQYMHLYKTLVDQRKVAP